jgi:hypothetical protein
MVRLNASPTNWNLILFSRNAKVRLMLDAGKADELIAIQRAVVLVDDGRIWLRWLRLLSGSMLMP